MIEEKLSKKVTVLFGRSVENKLRQICFESNRPMSNLIRVIVQTWMEKNCKDIGNIKRG